MAKKQNKSWFSEILQTLERISAGIPTDAEKEAAISHINALVHVFEEIKAKIAELPGDAQRKRLESPTNSQENTREPIARQGGRV